jgi:O-antigen biosynthesis protein WbqP
MNYHSIPNYRTYKRICDFVFALLLIPILALITPFIALIVCLESPGNPIFLQKRVGAHGRVFLLLKFRTMKIGTPELSTEDLLKAQISSVTSVGKFLRRTSIDELPQIINVLLGEMSFVGPRPALITQIDLLNLRKEDGTHTLTPGITGLAQIEGRDDLDIQQKAYFDNLYLMNSSLKFDLLIIYRTITAVLVNKGNK